MFRMLSAIILILSDVLLIIANEGKTFMSLGKYCKLMLSCFFFDNTFNIVIILIVDFISYLIVEFLFEEIKVL